MAATDPTFDPESEPRTVGDVSFSDAQAQEEPHAASDPTGGCPVTWCPICVTVGAVQPLAPDVLEHLLKAGTELFMAFRAVIDARADEASGDAASGAPSGSSTLEKIDLG